MEIKSVAKAHGFTMVQVAERMGISKGGLSQSINGNPTITSLRAVARAIGCEVGDFFKDEMTETESLPLVKCPHCGKPLKVKLEHVVGE